MGKNRGNSNVVYRKEFSCTTDRDFRFFILSHIPVPALGKYKEASHTSFRDGIVMLNDVTFRISAYSGFCGSLFHVFQYKMRYLEESEKMTSLIV